MPGNRRALVHATIPFRAPRPIQAWLVFTNGAILKHLISAALLVPGVASVCAQVVVKEAWVRATVLQQKATGAFMQLTAACDARLVDVGSTAAGSAWQQTG